MTTTEAAAALEEARLQQHMDRDREDLADGQRGPAEVGDRERLAQRLAITGGVYARRRRNARLIAALTQLIGACADAAGTVYWPIAAARSTRRAWRRTSCHASKSASAPPRCWTWPEPRTTPGGRPPWHGNEQRPGGPSPRGPAAPTH
ncbi:hypothetical protein [Streptomyces misionensis]